MKPIQLSPELRLLVQMVQQELLNQEIFFEVGQINWDKFRTTCSYHGMRHFAFSANQKQEVLPSKLATLYQKFAQQRAKSNLDNVIEIKRLYGLFEKNGIFPVLLKGSLFSQLLYQNKLLRESTDIDFLFKKEDALNGMEILLAENYTCRDFGVLIQSKDLKRDLSKLIFDSQFQELHFDKKPFNVDFHWELCNQFLHYQVDLGLFFKDYSTLDFYGKDLKVTNPTVLFWSLVLHHGGKELWLKFKDLVDLLAFMERYQHEMEWTLIIQQAKDFKIWTILKTGFWHLKQVFAYELPSILEQEILHFIPKNVDQVFDFWEQSAYWHKPGPRWKYEKILHYSQDESYTLWGYLYKLYQTYILPNPFERKRILNIPPGWGILNFMDKLLSYVFLNRQ
jgi:hypothetical protein